MNHHSPEFDPNEDLLKPSDKELKTAEIKKIIVGAAMKSTIPLVGTLTRNTTGTETDLFTSLLTVASSLSKTVSEELRSIKITDHTYFPLIQDIFLVPWNQKERDLFYSADKISMNEGEVVNVLGVAPATPSFDRKLTEDIKKFQTKLYKTSETAFLLGLRSFLWVHYDERDFKKEAAAARLTLRVLLGLKGGLFPFKEENDRVKLDKAIVPEIPDTGSVASLTFDIDLSQKPNPPLLHIEFGDFEKFENGDFVLVAKGKEKVAPRLEGIVNKPGLKKVAVNFSFEKLTFNLETQKVTALETLVSPGLRIGTTNYVVGALHLEDVDKEFKAEINKTIEAEVKKSGGKLLNLILGRKVE